MSLGSGSRETVTTQSNNSPWGPQQPYLLAGLEGARGRYGDPTSRVAPFSPETESGLQLGYRRGLLGNPLNQAAAGELQRTLGGEYLGADNPHLAGLTESIRSQVLPSVQGAFAQAGGAGSSGEQEAISRGMTNALAPFMFGQYNQERDNMFRAGAMAPGIANQDWLDINQMLGIGGMRDDLAQRQRLEPDRLLDEYLARVSGNLGATTTTATPFYRNRLSSGLGGALGGLALASSFDGISPGLGAGLGGLLGYFG